MTQLFVIATVVFAIGVLLVAAGVFAVQATLLDVARELRALVGEVAVAREPDMAVADAAGVTVTVEDLGDDPLNPHGDGTLRPGDPLFDAAMSGEGVLANRRDDGRWDVQTSAGSS